MRHHGGRDLVHFIGATLVVALLLPATGCRRRTVQSSTHESLVTTPQPPSADAPDRLDAPDRIDANEILETQDAAFGLPLPEGMAITKQLFGNVVVVGTMPMDDVVSYLRAHVDADVRSEPGLVTFTNVAVRKPRGVFRGTLRIEVARRGATTVVELWGDAAPAPSDSSEPTTARL